MISHGLTDEQTRHVFDRWLKQAKTKGALCPMGVGLSDTMEYAINAVADEYPNVKEETVLQANLTLERELKRIGSTPAETGRNS